MLRISRTHYYNHFLNGGRLVNKLGLTLLLIGGIQFPSLSANNLWDEDCLGFIQRQLQSFARNLYDGYVGYRLRPDDLMETAINSSVFHIMEAPTYEARSGSHEQIRRQLYLSVSHILRNPDIGIAHAQEIVVETKNILKALKLPNQNLLPSIFDIAVDLYRAREFDQDEAQFILKWALPLYRKDLNKSNLVDITKKVEEYFDVFRFSQDNQSLDHIKREFGLSENPLNQLISEITGTALQDDLNDSVFLPSNPREEPVKIERTVYVQQILSKLDTALNEIAGQALPVPIAESD